jgi:hypothetical protein
MTRTTKRIWDNGGWRNYAMVPVAAEFCPECRTLRGEFHDGCGEEICPRCEAQVLSCDCVYYEDDPKHDLRDAE